MIKTARSLTQRPSLCPSLGWLRESNPQTQSVQNTTFFSNFFLRPQLPRQQGLPQQRLENYFRERRRSSLLPSRSLESVSVGPAQWKTLLSLHGLDPCARHTHTHTCSLKRLCYVLQKLLLGELYTYEHKNILYIFCLIYFIGNLLFSQHRQDFDRCN